MRKLLIAHIYHNTAGNSGLYLNPIYDALVTKYNQKLYVNYYYPFKQNHTQKFFFRLTEKNENNPFKLMLRTNYCRKVIRYVELKYGNEKLINSIRAEQPDIINYSLTNMPDTQKILRKIKKYIPQAIIVVTCHDVVSFQTTKHIDYQGIYNLADFLLVHTVNAIDILHDFYLIQKNKIIYHPFPLIDLSKLIQTDCVNAPIARQNKEVPTFLFIGVIREEKGVQYLVDAWVRLGKEFGAKLIIAGFKPNNVTVDFTKLRDYKNVLLKIGFLSDYDYINTVAIADYVIFPYLRTGNSGVLSSIVSMNKVPVTTKLPTFIESKYCLEELSCEAGSVEALVSLLKKVKDNYVVNYNYEQKKIMQALLDEKKAFAESVKLAYEQIEMSIISKGRVKKMKIIHVCLTGGYSEGYSYQENYLTKYHALAGHQVTIITTEYCWHEGTWGFCGEKDYVNKYGVHVFRLPYKKKLPYRLNGYIGQFIGLEKYLDDIKPDIIFVHNIQFQDIRKIAAYKRNNPEVCIYVDNHSDFDNSAKNWLSKNILYKLIWRYFAHLIEPCTQKFYGVTPARVDFLKSIYCLPCQKCELLIMGGDDEKIEEVGRSGMRQVIRQRYGMSEKDFLIISGGKIDYHKIQILLLMEAVAKIDNPNVKLMIFGSVIPELKDRMQALCIADKIFCVGWISSDETYGYFSAADLAVFPCHHSVFWEQIVTQGIPMVCKYLEGMGHIDIGGNVKYLTKDSTEEMQKIIGKLSKRCDEYKDMVLAAQNVQKEIFMYSNIAKRSIEPHDNQVD